MIFDGKIMVGARADGPAFLLPSMATQHGIISGTTGSGKTLGMRVLAEGFSSLGVPVFMTDVKGDLGNVVYAGKQTEANSRRLIKCGVLPDRYLYRAFPANYWDIFEKSGIAIRTRVGEMDPLLLARLLELNTIQTDTLVMVFRKSKDLDLPMDDLRDLHAMLAYLAEQSKELRNEYGLFNPATIAVIQRQVYSLEESGACRFFGWPGIDILDWCRMDNDGLGVINVLNAEHIFDHPYLYTTFLLWILMELNRILPNIGMTDKPRFVLMIDEAQLLFKNFSSRLLSKIEQLFRLMRSKGVAIFLQTWNPTEIPAAIVRQLHNRMMFSMNAFTPLEQQNIRLIADTFPISPYFDVKNEIGRLGIGEAIVSFLKEDGSPGNTEKITILPPQSRIGVLPAETRQTIATWNPLYAKYASIKI